MELSEVVNPHFAFPVVGVVLCAVLVFAFGFKSPVQPPSFDSFEEDRKPRKSKHKKKPHSTEHLENHTGEKATASHKQSTNIRTPAAASKPAATADKSPHHQKDNKSKTKKSPVQKPVVSDVEVIRESPQDNEDGWETVSVSKKKKRNKKEQDVEVAYPTDKPPSRALGVHNEPATVTEPAPVMEPSSVMKPAKITEPKAVTEPTLVDEPEDIVSSDVKPQPQRNKREKSGKTKPKDAAKVIDLSDKENTPEPDMQVKQQIEEKPSAQSVKSEKKVKKNKTTEEHQLLEIQSTQSPGDSTKEKKSKTKKTTNKKEPTPQKEVPTSPANVAQTPAAETSVSPGSKSSKGQKSKRDKQKKEVSPPPVQELITSPDSISKVKSDISSSSQSTLSSAQESKKQVTAASSLSGTDTEAAPDKSAGTSVGNITFDELGDWQEAKPSKKRKSKVRRDN